MKQSRNRASLVRQAIRLAWGQGEPTNDIKRALDGSDAIVLRFYRRHEVVLAGPLQSVLEEEFRIKEPYVRVPLRIQTLYMHLDEVLSGRMNRVDASFDSAERRIKELM